MDLIADAICILKNGVNAGLKLVDIKNGNKTILDICKILKKEHFIKEYITRVEKGQVQIRAFIKFDNFRNPLLQGAKRVSRPGRRYYVGKENLPYVRNGLGIAIVSTSRGIMLAQQAKALGIGGEVLCYFW